MTRRAHADPIQEAVEVLEAASARGVVLRAVGGLAVKLTCPSASRAPLERTCKDIDLIGRAKQRRLIDTLLVDYGYAADEEFNLLNGDARLYYWDAANGRQLDVFLDRMDMCHILELGTRLETGSLAVSPTDLLLSKLQVVETNERDLKDAAALLLDCDIDRERVSALLASDWGWWRTVGMVLERLDAYASSLGRTEGGRLREVVDDLRRRIDAAPKSRRWKLRARVGDRKRWYELPEQDHVGELN